MYVCPSLAFVDQYMHGTAIRACLCSLCSTRVVTNVSPTYRLSKCCAPEVCLDRFRRDISFLTLEIWNSEFGMFAAGRSSTTVTNVFTVYFYLLDLKYRFCLYIFERNLRNLRSFVFHTHTLTKLPNLVLPLPSDVVTVSWCK